MKILEEIIELDYREKCSAAMDIRAYAEEVIEQKHKKIGQLNMEMRWEEEIGAFDQFISDVQDLETQYGIELNTSTELACILLEKIISSSQNMLDSNGVWEFCSKPNLDKCVTLQNHKISYLIKVLANQGKYFDGPKDIRELRSNEYKLIDLKDSQGKETTSNDTQKVALKTKMALLHKVKINDFLKKQLGIESTNVLAKFLGLMLNENAGTIQSYLSAAESTNASHNNPLSPKHSEAADDILRNLGVQLSKSR